MVACGPHPVLSVRPKQPQCALAGLFNQGNTCYMNCIMQCLAHTVPFGNLCQQNFHSHRCATRGQNCVLCTVENNVNRLLRPSGPRDGSFTPEALYRQMLSLDRGFEYGRQQDAHELLMCVLDTMEKDSKRALGPPSRSILEDVFNGRTVSTVACPQCGAVSSTPEGFSSLSLELRVAGQEGRVVGSIIDGLTAFTDPETLDWGNLFLCEGCNSYVPARKQLTIQDDPNILIIHLKRFDGLNKKICDQIHFPATLDLAPFMHTPPPVQHPHHAHPHQHTQQHPSPVSQSLPASRHTPVMAPPPRNPQPHGPAPEPGKLDPVPFDIDDMLDGSRDLQIGKGRAASLLNGGRSLFANHAGGSTNGSSHASGSGHANGAGSGNGSSSHANGVGGGGGAGGPPLYTLTGVAVHTGLKINSGHYYACVRGPAGRWHCANDASMTHMQQEEVLRKNAYLLFYTRTTMHLPRACPAPPAPGPARPPRAKPAYPRKPTPADLTSRKRPAAASALFSQYNDDAGEETEAGSSEAGAAANSAAPGSQQASAKRTKLQTHPTAYLPPLQTPPLPQPPPQPQPLPAMSFARPLSKAPSRPSGGFVYGPQPRPSPSCTPPPTSAPASPSPQPATRERRPATAADCLPSGSSASPPSDSRCVYGPQPRPSAPSHSAPPAAPASTSVSPSSAATGPNWQGPTEPSPQPSIPSLPTFQQPIVSPASDVPTEADRAAAAMVAEAAQTAPAAAAAAAAAVAAKPASATPPAEARSGAFPTAPAAANGIQSGPAAGDVSVPMGQATAADAESPAAPEANAASNCNGHATPVAGRQASNCHPSSLYRVDPNGHVTDTPLLAADVFAELPEEMSVGINQQRRQQQQTKPQTQQHEQPHRHQQHQQEQQQQQNHQQTQQQQQQQQQMQQQQQQQPDTQSPPSSPPQDSRSAAAIMARVAAMHLASSSSSSRPDSDMTVPESRPGSRCARRDLRPAGRVADSMETEAGVGSQKRAGRREAVETLVQAAFDGAEEAFKRAALGFLRDDPGFTAAARNAAICARSDRVPLEQFLSGSARPVGTKAFPVELSRALFTGMQRVGQAALDAPL
ncbi:MAG: hypothetical protein WDW36_007729 [Sanguina aurantia]